MKFQRIQDLRTDADLSQRELSEILHISQRSYSHYETGSRNIPIEMLIRLANYYDTSIDYLVGRTDRKKNDQIKKSPELETVREIPLSGFPYCYRSGDSLFIQYNMFLLRHKGFHIYLCHPGTKYLHFHCNMHSHQKHFQHQYCLLL